MSTAGSVRACVCSSGMSTSTASVTMCTNEDTTTIIGLRVFLWARDSINEFSSIFLLLLNEL